ncbi:MAG: bifunctional DNA-formamidopyrimidine glycosylase/DNA-(apurinic or apyrimidinic site) lyase [Anaerolineales bacterium]|nr:bifunctional DNA-formamidopyrimidine glycosylase/DNA-(apurinic or apyrimidinic site) lyase [Anaerolineales bacterium]
MPELPEVETIARNLREGRLGLQVPGQKIADISNDWRRQIAMPDWESFHEQLCGQTILDVQRRGKYLVFPCSKGTLLIHLRMSGDILLADHHQPAGGHEHTIFYFADGWSMRFSNTRKFGRVFYTTNPAAIYDKLGPEPLGDIFTANWFYSRLSRRKRKIKPLMMDQSFLAGMGNIYTDEALHRAHIHPERNADTLSFKEAETLWQYIRETLEEGIQRQGASIDWIYRGGDFQNAFQVYHRTGLPCPTCGTAIERILVGQRSTHFCPACQPETVP